MLTFLVRRILQTPLQHIHTTHYQQQQPQKSYGGGSTNHYTTADKEYTIPKTSAQEIRNIIDKTKNNKAPGIDLINGKILKNLPSKAIRLMTIIFNAILRIQYFPKPWKLAQIKMLHKPGEDPHQTASYRPISLLPVFSKILEK